MIDRIDDSIAGAEVAGGVADLCGQRVAAIVEGDATAPAAVALDDGASDRDCAIENGDDPTGVGNIRRAGNSLSRLVSQATPAGDCHHRRRGV